MNKNIKDITIALGGIIQAATLVNDLAVTGNCQPGPLKTMLGSILAQNPTSTAAIYGSENGVVYGLHKLTQLGLQDFDGNNKGITRYVFSLIHLERKLKRSKFRMSQLGEQIEKVSQQAQYFDCDHPTVIANLAQIYLDNISTYDFRIQVEGNPKYIHNPEIVNQVRALLLSGIRAAVLWRQVGGGKLHFVFNRRKILDTAKQIINSA